MGNGYWILVWDDWGAGLVMVNPRFHSEGLDMYNHPKNWFPCETTTTEEEIIEKHNLMQYKHFRVMR